MIAALLVATLFFFLANIVRSALEPIGDLIPQWAYLVMVLFGSAVGLFPALFGV